MNIVLLILVGWGLGWLVARSKIAAPIRDTALDWNIEFIDASRAMVREAGLDPDTATFSDGLRADVPPDFGRRYAPVGLGVVASGFLSGVLHCAACSGFWIGLALSVPLDLPWWQGGVIVMGANALLDAAVTALAAYAEDRHDQIDNRQQMQATVERLLSELPVIIDAVANARRESPESSAGEAH